jgi:hypothetical protein
MGPALFGSSTDYRSAHRLEAPRSRHDPYRPACNAVGVGFYLNLTLKRSPPLGQACSATPVAKDCRARTNFEANRDREAGSGDTHRDSGPNGSARSLGPLVDGLRDNVAR